MLNLQLDIIYIMICSNKLIYLQMCAKQQMTCVWMEAIGILLMAVRPAVNVFVPADFPEMIVQKWRRGKEGDMKMAWM